MIAAPRWLLRRNLDNNQLERPSVHSRIVFSEVTLVVTGCIKGASALAPVLMLTSCRLEYRFRRSK